MTETEPRTYMMEGNDKPILLNRIRTPDGTLLTSYSRHDYVTHKDANGLTYMVDGGRSYLRRTMHPDAPYEELSIELTDDHEANRAVFSWGTRGINADKPLDWVLLMDMSTDHIKAILRTQTHIAGTHIEALCRAELKHRRVGSEIEYELNFGKGKYTYRRFRDGGQDCLRFGEEWSDLTGDNMVMAMAQRIERLSELLIEQGLYVGDD